MTAQIVSPSETNIEEKANRTVVYLCSGKLSGFFACEKQQCTDVASLIVLPLFGTRIDVAILQQVIQLVQHDVFLLSNMSEVQF